MSFRNVTSSNALHDKPLETVHLKVTLVPATTSVTSVTGEVGSVIVAEPLTNVHNPVPANGTLCVIVKTDVLHNAWSGSSLTTGNASFCTVT